jgi:hypothetical protein
MKWGPENGDYKGVIAEANKLFKLQQPETQTINVEPKGKKVADGIYVNQESLTKEEQLELFDYLKPFLESQGKKTNKGANAPIMIGLNLRWDYKSNNPSLTPVNVGNNLAGRNTSYAYYDLSIDGKPLGKITQRFIELMNKSTGIDISNYDGAIINLYTNESFIGNHSDLEESATAEKYPVVVANIGGSGNIILGTDKNQIKVDLKSGASYLFGFKGKNRKIPHSTYASDVKGFLPSITISQEGKTFNTGSYRVSITMRRVMPLELGMSSEPIIISNINQQPKIQTGERIQKVYPEQIKLNNINIKVSTSKLQELANLIPNEIVEITWKDDKYIVNSVLKPLKDFYGIHAETYVEETNSDINKNEGEFLLNNPEFAKYFIEDYLLSEEGDGKTMQEYAQKLIDKNVTYKDTYQLSLFDNYDEGSGFEDKDNCKKRK